MTIPILFGKPIHFWFGMVLGLLLAFQIYNGIMMTKGKIKFLKIHRINAVLIIIFALLHIFFALSRYF